MPKKLLKLIWDGWITSLLMCGFAMQCLIAYDSYKWADVPIPETQAHHEQVTDALLHKCYPEGIYNPYASPICPDVNHIVQGELTRNSNQ